MIKSKNRMSGTHTAAANYLKEPYTRAVVPDRETGTYTAQVLEFPGCVAQGDTVAEAYERLEAVALSWIEAALDLGQQVPAPAAAAEYGGKVALRLPKSLHRQAAMAAGRDGTSLNQFIVMALAEKVGASSASVATSGAIEYRASHVRPLAAGGMLARDSTRGQTSKMRDDGQAKSHMIVSAGDGSPTAKIVGKSKPPV